LDNWQCRGEDDEFRLLSSFSVPGSLKNPAVEQMEIPAQSIGIFLPLGAGFMYGTSIVRSPFL
jgi:hypothetical protein